MIHQHIDECFNCPILIETSNRLDFFQSITSEVMAKKPLTDLLNEIIETSKSLLTAEAASLLFYDSKLNELVFETAVSPESVHLQTHSIPLGVGIAGWVAKEKKSLVIDDCYKDDRFNPAIDKASGFKTKNMICSPMLRKNELVGVIQVMNKIGGGSFSETDIGFLEGLSLSCAVAIENARLVDVELKNYHVSLELETAHQIQQLIMPKSLPQYNDIDVSVELIAAKELGGDYFNLIKLSDEETLFFLADVSGKSISASLIVSYLYSFSQTYLILNKKFNLVDFVEALNKFLVFSTTSDKFATAWAAVFNHRTKVLESINAGHNPPLCLREDKFIELSKGGLLLGAVETNYSSELLQILPGDKIIFYTDGVTEAMNNEDEEFGEERFYEFLISMKSNSSAEITKSLIDKLTRYRKSTEQSDDITCGIFQLI
ncbi:MAG: SpoIIE family protein phosphatase [Ignavibacteriaceae bacterium]|nr:SpoIIE family protein phosphatase [Ignavibacteriaceae bacterium]